MANWTDLFVCEISVTQFLIICQDLPNSKSFLIFTTVKTSKNSLRNEGLVISKEMFNILVAGATKPLLKPGWREEVV